MFRYVAVIWSTQSEPQVAAVNAIDARMRADEGDWRVVLSAPGLKVYCAGIRLGSSEAYRLDGDCGVVLGTVFTRVKSGDSVPGKAVFGAAETRRIIRTSGRCLAEDYWGRYVAFVRRPEDSSVIVMRSPTGELDCLSTEIRGVRIFCSGTHHCPPLDLRTFTINWQYVAADLATTLPDTRQTGLTGIERVLRAECVILREERVERLLHWHPFRFVNESAPEEPESAASELRRITYGCVSSWASCYDNIASMLSGGLDSSIVVGLLRRTSRQPECVCVNYRNPYDPVSDERRYARMVANRAGYRLIEMEQCAEFSFAPILTMPRTASPCLNVFGLVEIGVLAALGRAHRTKAWFVGEGGDEVFLKNAGEYHCADFVHRYGLRPRVVAIALEAARMTNRSLLPVLREGVAAGLTRNGLERILRQQELFSLLRSDVLDDVRKQRLFVPSWFDGHQSLAPGKCFQIISLSLSDTMHNPYAPDDDPELVYPLKSQPVQELCLRLPTHILAHGGKSRGLARVAFSDDLPPEIARRKSKGTVFDYVKALWISNRSLMRELLLDGLLVREGIVDKEKLEGSIAGTFDEGFANVARLASLACAEAWARNWEQARVRIAA